MLPSTFTIDIASGAACSKQALTSVFHSPQRASSPVVCRVLDLLSPHLSSHYPCEENSYQASWHMREGMPWETSLFQGLSTESVIELDIQKGVSAPSSLSSSYFWLLQTCFHHSSFVTQPDLIHDFLGLWLLPMCFVFFLNLSRLLTLSNITQVDFACQV